MDKTSKCHPLGITAAAAHGGAWQQVPPAHLTPGFPCLSAPAPSPALLPKVGVNGSRRQEGAGQGSSRTFGMPLRQSLWNRAPQATAPSPEHPRVGVSSFCLMVLPPGITSQLNHIQVLAPSSTFLSMQTKTMLYRMSTFSRQLGVIIINPSSLFTSSSVLD